MHVYTFVNIYPVNRAGRYSICHNKCDVCMYACEDTPSATINVMYVCMHVHGDDPSDVVREQRHVYT
jgi:hypothetical protein